jgi:hypothetical protein
MDKKELNIFYPKKNNSSESYSKIYKENNTKKVVSKATLVYCIC